MSFPLQKSRLSPDYLNSEAAQNLKGINITVTNVEPAGNVKLIYRIMLNAACLFVLLSEGIFRIDFIHRRF